MSFEPIAIVGRACLLPGADSPEALYALCHAGRDVLSDAPAGRWRLPEASVLVAPDARETTDRTWTRRGGYVDGFRFDGGGYALAAEALAGLDPLVHWLLDTARRALRDADRADDDASRTGAIIGNLSLPTSGAARYAESVWLGDLAAQAGVHAADPRDRFHGGLPAHLLARALGLGAGAYCLDAACASSLYAIELACRALQAGRADRMLAGAVNRADDLFLKVGFCALGAMSKSGQSRPFHRDADGLVAAEGCGFVVLERLSDAERAGRPIHGVIRAVGLANDGRGKGLLAPSERGQARSMRLALQQAELSPGDIPYIECHATGTTVGDATELASMAAVYGTRGLRIGSLKANLGHLVTAAGIAGLLKILESLKRETALATPHLDVRSAALASSPFEVLDAPAPWSGPPRAALSAFGFGGNDAHLIVERHDAASTRASAAMRTGAATVARAATTARDATDTPAGADARDTADTHAAADTRAAGARDAAPVGEAVVVVALGARVGDGGSVGDLERALFDGASVGAADRVRLPLRSLRFPPADLQKASSQQTLLLAAALEATEGLALPRETTGVFVGYQCDPEVARWGARWRAGAFADALGEDAAWAARARDVFAPGLEAPHVVGTLPNVPANRLSSQLDLQGPSFTTSAEELSGLRALDIAVEALARGDLDAALVGAVDLSVEPVHVAALARVDPDRPRQAGDAAVVLVLRREADAHREGLPMLARVERRSARLTEDPAAAAKVAASAARLPHAHAASGLLEVVAAVLELARADDPGGARVVEVAALAGERMAFTVRATGAARPSHVAAMEPTPTAPEPALELAAHPPRVLLARTPGAASAETRETMQTMSPAPALPPSSDDGPPGPPLSPAELRALLLTPTMAAAAVGPSPAAQATDPTRPARGAGSAARGQGAKAADARREPMTVHVHDELPRATASPRAAAPVAASPSARTRGAASPDAAAPVAASHSAASASAASHSAASHSAGSPGAGSSNALSGGAPAAPPPQDGWIAAFAAQQVRIADAHQHFLLAQAAVHQQFLASLLAPPGLMGAVPMPHAGPVHPALGVAGQVAAPSSTQGTVLVSTPAPAAAPHAAAGLVTAAPMTAHVTATPAARTPTAAAPRAATPVVVSPPSARSVAPDALPLAFRPRGPSFDCAALAVHAGGTISEIFGPLFAQQDEHAVQVRMPEPPLLLADRATGLDAEPGSMKKGTCWTETDVRPDSWYLHDGAMPTGIMVESGQADLFLISYLGADFLNRGERAYRLLGCEMTWRGPLPKIGETLAYDIHVDGHAAQGDVRLFFFHYDCHVRRADGTIRPALEVRGGQAGFFTAEELAASAGILWRPETQAIRADARVDAPAVPLEARAYEREAIEAFAAGRPWACFGEGFLRTKTHTKTPRIQGGRMLFLDRVEVLDPRGGPWGRGYLKAVTPIAPDDWFFEGHFKNDPCMPGTLMLEGCVQAMAFYLSALGYTIDRDGWRFAPIPDETYSLRCRGQVTPKSRALTYEIFVEEVHDGPEPRLYADLLCTVDGLGAFHARRFGLALTPGWPLESRPELLDAGHGDPRAATASWQGEPAFRFDLPSLLACAWGRPSTAFGPMYERFDGARRTPRLPGPPYHFLSRVTRVDGDMGGFAAGKTLEFEYDIPEDAWYFAENGARVMPFAVLLEAALQPCGWTASFIGSTLTKDSDFLFRNLDGKGTIKAEIPPDAGTLRTVVTLTNVSASGGMIIESFRLRSYVGDVEVYELDTVFGFFPPEAFRDQAGLPTTDAQRALFAALSNVHVDLTATPQLTAGSLSTPSTSSTSSTLRLARPMLLMIDRVTHFDPKGGPAGLGALRAEKDVDPGEWFFKAHFYQDPVQPGSLGVEAMLQLLQVYMLETGQGAGLARPRFEAIATGLPHVWKYRGQVVPENRVITTTLEIVEVGVDARGAYALGDASLWVDGKRIYEAKRLGMRVVEGAPERKNATSLDEEILDPAVDTWLGDHRPTYTAPALPMMSMVDRLVAAARRARGGSVDGLRDLRVERWVVCAGPTRLRTEVEGDEVRLLVWRDAPNAALSRFEVAARATIGAPASFEPLAPLGPTRAIEPYGADRLFHGAAFQLARSLSIGAKGSRAILDAAGGAVPFGHLNQGLLDAATHAIPHDALCAWSERIPADTVGYPHRLDVRFLGEAPRTGEVECEVRLIGFEGEAGLSEHDASADEPPRFPVFRVQLSVSGRVFCEMRLVEVLFPKGPLGAAAPVDRRRFLQDRAPVAGVGLSRREGDETVLRALDVSLSGWFPGTVRAVYGSEAPRDIAMKDHLAAARAVHPSTVEVRDDLAVDTHVPLTAQPLVVEEREGLVRVRDAGPPRLDLGLVRAFWRGHLGVGEWPVETLFFALVERFVAAFHVEDPAALARVRGRGVVYLANHQVGIESLLFSIVASALQGVPTRTLAKAEHRASWIGELIAHCFSWPGVEDPGVIAYFERSDPTSLPRIAQELGREAGARSLMIHVEGTRAHSARHRVEKMSGIFCDLAIEAGVPVVPVRFSGGLPIAPTPDKLEYPVGMGKQEVWLGRPIGPDELRAVPYKARIDRVVRAIEGLGPRPELEVPLAGDPALEAAVTARVRTGVPIGPATVLEVLRGAELGAPLTRLLATDPIVTSALGEDAESRWLAGLGAMLSPR